MDKRRWLAGRMTFSAEDRDAARVAARRGRHEPRETVATLMLGTSSIAFAMVTIVATLPGVFGLEFPRWSERRAFMVEASPGKFDRDPFTGQKVPVLVPAGSVHVPSHECDLLAFLSLILGAIGIALSVRRGRFSYLSVIGFSVTLLMMAIVVSYSVLGTVVR